MNTKTGLTLVLVLSAGATGWAGPILVNGDFEAPLILGPGQTGVPVCGAKWISTAPPGRGYSTAIAGITGWTYASPTDSGTHSDHGLARLNVSFGLPASGQSAFINNWNRLMTQTVNIPVAAGDTVSTSIDFGTLGSATDRGRAGRFYLVVGEANPLDRDQFSARSIILDEVSVANPSWSLFVPGVTVANGRYVRLTLSYTYHPGDPALSLPLTVAFRTVTSSVGQTYWDNASLQLDHGPVGEACVFRQDNAPIVIEVGHVAWGWKIAGSNPERWVFGSTDGKPRVPYIKPGEDNGVWVKEGDRNAMLDTFRHLGYKEFKCEATETSAVKAAYQTIEQVKKAGYDFIGILPGLQGKPGNNGMDHTVKILTAYGAGDMPNPTLVETPDLFFWLLGDPWHYGKLESQPSVDWKNTRYTVDCDMSVPITVDVRNGHAERPPDNAYSRNGYIVDVEAVTRPQDLTGDGKPETVVLLSCSPQPSNFRLQEVQVFTDGSKLLATLPDLDPLPTGLRLSPVFNPSEFTIRDGKLVTGVRYYSATDSHASGPSIHRVLTWRWNGRGFETDKRPKGRGLRER